jgi:hypothetical protein
LNTAPDVIREHLRPPEPAGVGREWVVEPIPGWEIADEGATCRGQGDKPADGTRARAHGAPAAVRTKRGIGRPVDWNYCADHAANDYAVWVEDGVVVHWARREAGT